MKVLTDNSLTILWNRLKKGVLNNRNYKPTEFSGKGYKVLEKNIQTINGIKKNILTAIMLSEANTIYEIRYDFDLNGGTINVPENCTLKFEGGSLRNGFVNGIMTKVANRDNAYIFKEIELNGTWNMSYIHPEYFGAIGDGLTDDYNCLQKSIDFIYNKGIELRLLGKDYISSRNLIVWTDNIHDVVIKGISMRDTKILKRGKEYNNNIESYVYSKDCIINIFNEFYKEPSKKNEILNSSKVFLSNLSLGSENSESHNDVGIGCISLSSSVFSNIDIRNVTNGVEFIYNSYLNKFNKINIYGTNYGFYSPRTGVGSAANTTLSFYDCHTDNIKKADYYISGACLLVNCAKDGGENPNCSFIKTDSVPFENYEARSRIMLISCHVEARRANPIFDIKATTLIIDGGVIEIPNNKIFKLSNNSFCSIRNCTLWATPNEDVYSTAVLSELKSCSSIHFDNCIINETLFSKSDVLKNSDTILYQKGINKLSYIDDDNSDIVQETDNGEYLDLNIKNGNDKGYFIFLGENLQEKYTRLKIILEAENIPKHVEITYVNSNEISDKKRPINGKNTNIAYQAVDPYYEYESCLLGNTPSGGKKVVTKKDLIGCNLGNLKYHFLQIYLSLNTEFNIRIYKIALD